MKKTLWFDVETGGTDSEKDALLQLAGLIEIDNEIVDEINLKIQPVKGKNVTAEAIKKHGLTMDMIEGFEKPWEARWKFDTFLTRNNPAPAKDKRYIMAGYNADFDCRFLNQWYQDLSGGPYDYWKHLQFSPVDPLPTLRIMRHLELLDVPDTKLETVCDYFGITINAHDALSDIKATREVSKIVFSLLQSGFAVQVVRMRKAV